jgi:AGAP007375-PA
MTNAIKNSIKLSPSGKLIDDSTAIAISPNLQNKSAITKSKAAITNASFKTRKLPDDIPIINSNNCNSKLVVIKEDNQEKVK